MGKSKTKKYKNTTPNPTGIPSVKELEMEEQEIIMPVNIDAGTIESIIEKLQSTKSEDKECAAVIIANMTHSPQFVSALLEEKVIRIAAPLLVDRNLAVRHAVAGCLRNIAVCGDYSVSEAMVEQDTMTSLVSLFEQYKESWVPGKKEENEQKIDSKSEIFIEACNLLWSLCENSNTAVTIFNQSCLIRILLPCLNVDIYGLQIPLAVAQCLHTVGENNPDLSEMLRQLAVEDQLKILMNLPSTESKHMLLRVLAAGIKLNMFSGKLDNCMSDIAASVLEVIFATFNESTTNALELLSQQILKYKTEKADKYHDEKELEDMQTLVEETHKNVKDLLSAKQICLEMLGNMFEDDDDESDWGDVSSSDCSEIAENTGMEVDESTVSCSDMNPRLPFDIYKTLVNSNILDKVVQQMDADAPANISSTSEAKECLEKIQSLKCTALLCLNNILQKVDMEDLGGPTCLLDLWVRLATHLFKETDPSAVDQVEALTRSLSAVIRKLAEADCPAFFGHMTEADLQLLLDICSKSTDPRIRVHVLRVLGTLGCLLGTLQEVPSAAHLVKVIGLFLLDICNKSSMMWVTAEALDAIFDVFAEDPVDSIAREINLVEKLSHLLPTFKGKIKQQRKSLGEHLPVIMTAKDNLVRFIKYKNEMKNK